MDYTPVTSEWAAYQIPTSSMYFDEHVQHLFQLRWDKGNCTNSHVDDVDSVHVQCTLSFQNSANSYYLPMSILLSLCTCTRTFSLPTGSGACTLFLTV